MHTIIEILFQEKKNENDIGKDLLVKDFKLHAEMIIITQFVRSFRFAIIYTKTF